MKSWFVRVPPKSRQSVRAQIRFLGKIAKERIMSKKIKANEYSAEFKENAVRRTRMRGKTVASVAMELKIPAWKLRNWIGEEKEKLERSSDLDEMTRLHNEVARLKQENEILKKAAAYFARSLQ